MMWELLTQLFCYNSVNLALEEWRYWLEGATHPFFVWMDHKNLAYIQEAEFRG